MAKKQQQKVKIELGWFIRCEDENRGFITGIFQCQRGTFYELDGTGTTDTFVHESTIVAFSPMTEVKRTTKRRRSLGPKAGETLESDSGVHEGAHDDAETIVHGSSGNDGHTAEQQFAGEP